MTKRQINAGVFLALYLVFLAWYDGWGMSPLTAAEVEQYLANLAPDSEGIEFLDTFVNFTEPLLFERQMFEQFKDMLGLSKEENSRACAEGMKALGVFYSSLRAEGRQILDVLEAEERIGVGRHTAEFGFDAVNAVAHWGVVAAWRFLAESRQRSCEVGLAQQTEFRLGGQRAVEDGHLDPSRVEGGAYRRPSLLFAHRLTCLLLFLDLLAPGMGPALCPGVERPSQRRVERTITIVAATQALEDYLGVVDRVGHHGGIRR